MMRAVVLSGGGAKGGYQVGAWKALNELGFYPNIVTGTSVGALNGALMALDEFETAYNIWENVHMGSIFTRFVNDSENGKLISEKTFSQITKLIISDRGADYTPLQNLVKSLMNEDKLRNSKIKYGLVTTKLPTVRPVELFIDDIPKGEAADYVIASAAAFPFMKSYKIGTNTFVDGGYSDNMPINMALSSGADEVVAINTSKVNAGKLKYTNAKIHLVQSKRPFNDGAFGSMMYFDETISRQNIMQGYLDTYKAFGRYDGYYYTFELHEKYKITKYESGCKKRFEFIFSGLPNVTRIEKTGREKVIEYLKEYEDRPFEFNSNVMFCAEIAAEIFKINPRVIYTLDELCNCIYKELKTLISEEIIVKADALNNLFEKGLSLELLRKLIDSRDKISLTALAIHLLQDLQLEPKHKRRLWIISALFPDVFCAAIFCCSLLDIVEENK